MKFCQDTRPGSAVHGPAWPESRGFGLAQAGSGFVKPQAKPKPLLTAWLRLGLAQAAAFEWKNILYKKVIYVQTFETNNNASRHNP